MTKQRIIISGNPLDGFTFTGPFDDPERATTWAERELDGEWWLGQLDLPDGENLEIGDRIKKDGKSACSFPTPAEYGLWLLVDTSHDWEIIAKFDSKADAEAYLNNSASIDPGKLEAGEYEIESPDPDDFMWSVAGYLGLPHLPLSSDFVAFCINVSDTHSVEQAAESWQVRQQ